MPAKKRRSRGHWRDFANVEAELRRVIAEIGQFPKQHELYQLGLSGLNDSILRFHGGLRSVRTRFGSPLPSKPMAYWQSWENTKRALLRVIAETGRFPSSSDLTKRKQSGLLNAIHKYHGGMRVARERMGHVPTGKKQHGYWQTWENVERELCRLIREIGRFPSHSDLAREKLGGLIHAIHDYHGGIDSVRERMGYPSLRRNFRSWENVERELQKIIAELGHFPKTNELRRYPGLLGSIHTHHGGVIAVAKRLGYLQLVKPRGYWANWENIERELRIIEVKLGRFPGAKDLVEIQPSLLVAIGKYHGGMTFVRERLGIQLEHKPHGFWQKWENVDRELRGLIARIGRFPTMTEIAMSCGKGLASGITRHHGGIHAVRKGMGYRSPRNQAGYWQDWVNVERELGKIIAELGRFPSSDEIRDRGVGGLLDAIHSHHGGIRAVRKRLGFASHRKPRGYWKSWSNVSREFRKVLKELGHFPNLKELQHRKLFALANAILKYHGGFVSMRGRLGYGPITTELLREYADQLARIVISLRVRNSEKFWAAMREWWTAKDLVEAIRAFEERGELRRFRKLLKAAG